jgi:hypothetical protein
MKTMFQSILNAIKANKETIRRKATVAVGVAAGTVVVSAVVDHIRKASSDTNVSGVITFDAPSDENPFNSL